ncbi:unnamed protein product [Prorocentrum cordatum]|uniref:Uncharacterized protein n=1 Tax=Prorocentrum cordatum TaxID=2364126 RepID=A0ABN9TTT5_9DINO|nr:unnamed protein product [Polarella glacialis]
MRCLHRGLCEVLPGLPWLRGRPRRRARRLHPGNLNHGRGEFGNGILACRRKPWQWSCEIDKGGAWRRSDVEMASTAWLGMTIRFVMVLDFVLLFPPLLYDLEALLLEVPTSMWWSSRSPKR